MREATGSTWIFGLMTIFIFLFSAFLILALNYSSVFAHRNEMLSILEKYEGYSDTTNQVLNNYLSYNGYNTKGECPEGYYGENDLSNSSRIGKAVPGEKYNYCLKNDGNYIDIILFYNFNLPLIGDLITFDITGRTQEIVHINMSGVI